MEKNDTFHNWFKIHTTIKSLGSVTYLKNKLIHFIELIKNDSKAIHNVTRFLFQINATVLNYVFTKESWKNCTMV